MGPLVARPAWIVNLRALDTPEAPGVDTAMAATPTPEQVRVLLTDPKQAPADLDRLGSLFLEEGRPNIAMMFFERSGSKETLGRVLRPAV